MRILLAVFCFSCIHGFAQMEDTLRTKQLDEVVVTATRSERSLSELPVPVKVISGEQIKTIGSLRLSDVLTEQTGLAVINDHGTGIQLQGFDPDYTLILIDGEPLIGRSAGVLELTRIAVGNIKQIEIVKGPSSSLYGTEALAGVVNIITEKPARTTGTFNARYGTNNTLDVGASLGIKKAKWDAYLFANRYSTGGYDLDKETVGSTISPFDNYTLQTKLGYKLSKKTSLSVSARYFSEYTKSESITVESSEGLDIISKTNDWNVNPVLTHKFSDKLKTTFRFYGTGYENTTDYLYKNDGSYYDSSFFKQRLYKPEIQTEYFINSENIITLGLGRIWETVEATRYDTKMQYETNYAYAQYEWQPTEKLNINAGGRYDHNLAYAAQFSPKLSVQYEVNKWISARASFGVGFRAPDFRQLYLNFTNTTVGYSVFGTQEVVAGIQRLINSGEIENPEEDILVDPSSISKIKSESSQAYNLGVTLKPINNGTLSIGLFRNNVKDLIDTRAVAQKSNGQFVYSYLNLARVFMQGVETEATYSLNQSLRFSAGYQYLVAKDKTVVDDIENGDVYKKDPETNITTRVKSEEYGGLFNRSRHMFNAKVFYNDARSGLNGSLRCIYRGRYGYADMNNSTVLDDDSEYIDGYATVNLALSKSFKEVVTLQVGCDNLFNYTNSQFIATLPGRLVWVSVAATIGSNKSKQ